MCEICSRPGQPRPTLGAATQRQPTGVPPAWEDREQRTLELVDLVHWVEEDLSNQGRLEAALQLVEEASCNPDLAIGENFSLSLVAEIPCFRQIIITIISKTIPMMLIISGSSMEGTHFQSAL